MPHPQTYAGSKVIDFPLAARERRVSRREDTERGTILLFTGVRYERLEEEGDESGTEDFTCSRRDEIWS